MARTNASGRNPRGPSFAATGRGTRPATRLVHIWAGQSNVSAYSQMVILGPSANVAGFAKTNLNEWTGASPVSTSSGLQYNFPTSVNAPCLWNENTNGTIGSVYDGWGPVLKQYPNSSGVLQNTSQNASGSYGPEFSFMMSHLANNPSVPLAGIKVSLGGTSLASDWMPANTGSNAGADKAQFAILRLMINQAAARLNAAGSPWRWGSFIWLQGENGAHTTTGIPANDNAYLSDARAMFGVVRTLTRSNLPVVVGRIGDSWGWGNVGDPNTTTNANPFLIQQGYPWAAIDASISFSLGGNGDGRVAQSQSTRNNCLGGARLRRQTQVTLGGDANCTWWSNDGFPPKTPYWKQHSDFWGYDPATVTDPDPVNGYDFFAYHWASPGNMAAGEGAYAAYHSIAN